MKRFFTALSSVILLSCSVLPDKVQASDSQPWNIVTDVGFIASLVSNIVGDHGSVKPLITGQQSPHHASLSPSAARAISKANLLVWLGPTFTPTLAKPLNVLAPNTQRMTLLELADLTWHPVREAGVHHHENHGHDDHHAEHGADPHLWLDPSNLQQWVKALAQFLASNDAANAESYQRNAAVVLTQLEQFDTQTAMRFKSLTRKNFVMLHDATQYFEKRYNLESLGALVANDDLSPSAHDLYAVQQVMEQEPVACVIADLNSDFRWAKTLTENPNAAAIQVDVLGQQFDIDTQQYLKTLMHVSDALFKCMDNHE